MTYGASHNVGSWDLESRGISTGMRFRAKLARNLTSIRYLTHHDDKLKQAKCIAESRSSISGRYGEQTAFLTQAVSHGESMDGLPLSTQSLDIACKHTQTNNEQFNLVRNKEHTCDSGEHMMV